MYPTGIQLLSCSSVIIFLLGLLNLHFSNREDFCAMTYMFEYPQFVNIEMESSNMKPQYSLYAYSEGRLTERARKMWFDGVPVLFLPGNSGSHKQARSLASVALQKAMDKGHDYHFDYFTISFNEELSGFYGGVLLDQTQFATQAIAKILSLYKNNKYTQHVPTSVILIGHSMGGVLAKRLLAYNDTINTTNIAITLAAPLEAPPINTDLAMEQYYSLMKAEWKAMEDTALKDKKLLLSFGGGARDILVSSALTSSDDSFVNALTTAIPGVWVSPDHVSMVWCKQLVLAINRYLFDVVDPVTQQITQNTQLWKSKAIWYFQANRSTTLSPNIRRAVKPMLADAFWYEDNRRIYQIDRPEIKKTTYLMVRLVHFPQNRFAAIEAVNVDEKDWVFGCNAKFTHNNYRYCKEATSLTELSRWTGTASTQIPRAQVQAGKPPASPTGRRRKLATIDLHQIKADNPEWTHVIVKVSPTKKPVTLNVDINELTSRQITVDLPNAIQITKRVVTQKTEQDSLYYELILPDLQMVHQAFLLYVEPSENCKDYQYHVSAELHVPWAKNFEYYHYFTQQKRSPMKLTLFKSNPNITSGMNISDYAKVILLLDPKCTFKISISQSWYNRIGQFVRHFTPSLFPYMVAVILSAAINNLLHLKEHGSCISMVAALTSYGFIGFAKDLVFARIIAEFWNLDYNNLEVQYLTRSLLTAPAMLVALGLAHALAITVLCCMVFSSQIAHKLLFRIMWRGGPGLAEKVAGVVQKIPAVVTLGLLCAAQLSCGAAALAAGAAFYGFMLSKMYEEYLEDYFYKLLAKMSAKVWKLTSMRQRKNVKTSNFKAIEDKPRDIFDKESNSCTDQEFMENPSENKNIKSIEHKKVDDPELKDLPKTTEVDNNKIAVIVKNINTEKENTLTPDSSEKDKTSDSPKTNDDTKDNEDETNKENKDKISYGDESDVIDEDLSKINFHMMMYLLWIIVTLFNIPVLLIWARNFKYNMVLPFDTSYFPGVVLSVCSYFIWQIDRPRVSLNPYTFYLLVQMPLSLTTIYSIVIGHFSLGQVNYLVTVTFALITISLIFSKDTQEQEENNSDLPRDNSSENTDKPSENADENVTSRKENESNATSDKDCSKSDEASVSQINSDGDRIRNKLSFAQEDVDLGGDSQDGATIAQAESSKCVMT